MSHVVTRAGAAGDDPRKQTSSPVKEMKKKMAANAEKEKQAAEKNASNEKQTDKHNEKNAEKHNENQTEKQSEQSNKQSEKHNDKHVAQHNEKHAEKSAKQIDKQSDKNSEKQNNKQTEKHNDKQTEKQGEKNVDKQPDKKTEKNVEKNVEKTPSESTDSKGEKGEKDSKLGRAHQSNKSSLVSAPVPAHKDAHTQNGIKDAVNGTSSVSPDTEDDDLKELEKDEHFPELVYEDGSDNESFEPSSEGGHHRSLTRRSQVKNTRTPETPKPMTDKQTDKEAIVNGDDKAQENVNSTPKDTKILKLKDDVPASDRRLRSADRSTPDIKEDKEPESKTQENGQDSVTYAAEVDEAEIDKVEESRRKIDTNYAKSRVKVSPYRRSARVHDHTATSTAANYTGNNTTMEMDITESFTERPSGSEDPSLMDDSYIGGLRNIKGRRSYKQLKELSMKELAANRSKREAVKANLSVTIESRPTGHVVGRKRRPADDEQPHIEDYMTVEAPGVKRMRLVERVFSPFIRKTVASSTPLPARRAAPIVGINTDLPLSAPTATEEPFDPETLKTVQQTNPDSVTSKRCCIQ